MHCLCIFLNKVDGVLSMFVSNASIACLYFSH
jgi:hypothetical protein